MKIAVVVPTAWYSSDPSKFSVDLELYVQAIIDLGHEPLLVCGQSSIYEVNYPVKSATLDELEQQQFWESLGLDIAIVFTWLRFSQVLSALSEAGIYTISRADVDGQLSVKVFPWHHYRMTTYGVKNPMKKLVGIRHLIRRYFLFSKQADQQVVNSLTAANAVMIETIAAKQKIEKFLLHYHKTELLEKIFVQAHYVADDLLSSDVMKKSNKIVAVGRWEDPQKDGQLMLKTLSLYLKKHPQTEVIIIGRSGKEVFNSLFKLYPSLHCLGAIPRTEIKRHLSNCRVILFTSRWEGAPVSACETLALGGTIVGPPIPGIEGFCLGKKFGRVSSGRRPTQMVQALEYEMADWENGVRDPKEIARFWRPKLSAINSMREMIQMAERNNHPKLRPSS